MPGLNATMRSAFIVAALIAPGLSPALTLSHSLPAAEVPAPPAVVSYLVFESAEASSPVDVVDFSSGSYQLKRENDLVRINTELGDELRSEDLWVQLEIDGAPVGERVRLESLTLGVTFALGNTLNMDGNSILGLEMPALPGTGSDVANRAYVDNKVATGGDNLGDHTATANIQLGTNWLSGDGGSEGIQVGPYGKVGIGTAPGSANLVVAGMDGILASGALGQGSIPAEGKGVRFMWYPKKAALRAGLVDSSQWDDGNIGDYSTAMGYDTTANGAASTAMGLRTIASGYASTAMGSSTTASGFYSMAMGEGTTASGNFSTAMGNSATASHDGATAMGYDSTASGAYSTAMGNVTIASGGVSLAMGNRTTASGTNSTAMGYKTTALSGYETVVGRYNTGYTPAEADGWDSADRLFVIGNGEGSPSDAMVVLKSGDTTINGETTINGKLLVSQLGGGGSQPLCLNGNNVLALCPPPSPDSSSSSIRYKNGVAALLPGLEAVQQLTAVLVNTVKEQQEQIGLQRERIENLEAIVCADHPGAEMCL